MVQRHTHDNSPHLSHLWNDNRPPVSRWSVRGGGRITRDQSGITSACFAGAVEVRRGVVLFWPPVSGLPIPLRLGAAGVRVWSSPSPRGRRHQSPANNTERVTTRLSPSSVTPPRDTHTHTLEMRAHGIGRLCSVLSMFTLTSTITITSRSVTIITNSSVTTITNRTVTTVTTTRSYWLVTASTWPDRTVTIDTYTSYDRYHCPAALLVHLTARSDTNTRITAWITVQFGSQRPWWPFWHSPRSSTSAGPGGVADRVGGPPAWSTGHATTANAATAEQKRTVKSQPSEF